MAYDSHLTAIRRGRASRPGRALVEKRLVPAKDGWARFVLDYGAGFGDDAQAHGWHAYDPNFSNISELPTWPAKFDYIVCIYVLCVCTRNEIVDIMGDILRRLRPGGVAYFAVRRDGGRQLGVIERAGGKRTYQSDVYLDLPRVLSTYGFDIYEWRKDAGRTNDIHEECARAEASALIKFVGTEGCGIQPEDVGKEEEDDQ